MNQMDAKWTLLQIDFNITLPEDSEANMIVFREM